MFKFILSHFGSASLRQDLDLLAGRVAKAEAEADRAYRLADKADDRAIEADSRVDELEERIKALSLHLGLTVEPNPKRGQMPPRFVVMTLDEYMRTVEPPPGTATEFRKDS